MTSAPAGISTVALTSARPSLCKMYLEWEESDWWFLKNVIISLKIFMSWFLRKIATTGVLGFEPCTSGYYAHTNPLSHGSSPIRLHETYLAFETQQWDMRAVKGKTPRPRPPCSDVSSNALTYMPKTILLYFKAGPFPASSVFIFVSSINLTESVYKICWWLDSNCLPLVSEMTTLPTAPYLTSL